MYCISNNDIILRDKIVICYLYSVIMFELCVSHHLRTYAITTNSLWPFIVTNIIYRVYQISLD